MKKVQIPLSTGIIKSLISLSIQIGLMVIAYYWYINNDYMNHKDRLVEVLDKYEEIKYSKKRSYSRTDYYIYARDVESGINFELAVTRYSYLKELEIGKRYYFKLRRSDIKQTPYDNAINFFGFVCFIGALLLKSIIFIFSFTFKQLEMIAGLKKTDGKYVIEYEKEK